MAREKPVSVVLDEVFRRGGMKRSLKRAQVVVLWTRVAGRELSRFTRARAFRDGVLFVDTSDSETAMHLSMQRLRFIEGFTELGHPQVREIRFQPGRGTLEPAEDEPLPGVKADPGELARLHAALARLPSDLAQPALQAAGGIALARARQRQLGWLPCRVCGSLCEGGDLCLSCARYRASPAVQRAVRILMVEPADPVGFLTDGQRAVAAWIAARALETEMTAHLPAVLADDSERDRLELLAVRFLVLDTGRPEAELTDMDWLRLPTAVGRILGRT